MRFEQLKPLFLQSTHDEQVKMFAEYRKRRNIDIQTYIASKVKVTKGKKSGNVNFTLTDSEKELIKKLGLSQKDLMKMKME